MLMVQALIGPPWAFHAGDVAYIHSDETHDLSFTAMRLHEKFGLDIDTIPYGCRRNVSRQRWSNVQQRKRPCSSSLSMLNGSL
jgi:hypothetical protein